ncbi:MAG: bifunctional 2-polyprenyl-6-hydroxyphenol methylase/3-demethylubiquinol 3-O-methyltransferase UbiG [Defluviicoccus sp.]|nr:bifunctional 2-polyprenyl-6-hydroxyphenol methylase/3-demethylubiquinol 3-O-methyltransferase UbiG [Defluviicoccus sp.]MDG4591968.1 bifunctional 2-polyprenyl-6-hydroxyphenol methylase/3-demethylubiquinol 3-O-methyltransferase UbiG [Defluviicoccus sp.]
MTSAAKGSAVPAGGTASDDEIARFDAMAEAWWDPMGKFRPLHELNPVRFDFIRGAIARHRAVDAAAALPFTGLRCLDLGCGGGLIAEEMAKHGAAVTGVDASQVAIRVARAHAEREGLAIDYRCALPEDVVGWEARYDVVLALEVIEHVQSLDLFFEAVGQILTPDGLLVVATLNRTLSSLALAKIGAEYILRWLPAGTHDWRKFVRPSELARVLRRQGFELAEIRGLQYQPLLHRWSLGSDLMVNYIAAVVRAAS